ncbi:MAG TPA: ammonia-forming cytochrome c nitrite reductase subunit c552, partial [Kofleriaceae bacterium]|nr:ammonia-forming cytochrome c nitrite reductase subunit c552 [Kofleriaceae bacterium]
FARERRDPDLVGAVCAQCHSGPSPRLPDGAALRNSSESLDLAASPCTGIKCTDCHDPHRGGADPARAIAACTGCHPTVSPRAHAGDGHDAVTCLDCHMPRIVMGIDRFVRSHRISSPTDPVMLARAAPNACNLCHLDRSIQWTLDEIALRHGVRLDPRAVAGDADPDASVGEVWLSSPQPGIRLVAAAAYAASPLGRFALRDLVRGLDDDLAYVRAWTQFAVEDILGRRLPPAAYDPRDPRPVRRARIERLVRALAARSR